MTPAAGVGVRTVPGWIGHASILYMKPRRSGLDYALERPFSSLDPPVNVWSLDLDASPGLRVGVGKLFESGWDMTFTYTCLLSEDAEVARRIGQGNLLATRLHPSQLLGTDVIDFAGSTNPGEARGQANLIYNVFDWDFGYWVQPTNDISIRVFFGARAGRITQDFRADYFNLNDDADQSATFRHDTVLEGAGVRLGCETHWDVRPALSVFGRGAVGVLAGEIDSYYDERHRDLGSGNFVFHRDDYFETIPMLEAAIGATYMRECWSLQMGYELTSWMNAAQRFSFADGAGGGSRSAHSRSPHDLGLDGLFLRWLYFR